MRDLTAPARGPFSQRKVAAVAMAVAVIASAAGSSAVLPTGGAAAEDASASASTPERLGPVFHPTGFGHPRNNPFFPLRAGLVTRLRGSEDGVHYRELVRVTARRRPIDGVRASVLRDVLRRADGSLAERTTDWYADDDAGNVWYLGERTATFDRHGHLDSREGSWRAGIDGAKPGLIMPADPRATDAYRQEWYPGHAEDQAWIVGYVPTVRTPARPFHHVLRSFEWTRLEPRVMSQKLYAQGVGIVAEHDIAGGNEQFQLVSVHHR